MNGTTDEAPAIGRHHVPDILDCLAQLSNDKVPTPPDLARAMLDLLPDEVWTNPGLRFLDPCSKSGVFLREIVKRLLAGLESWEPDFNTRREHIFRNMVWGTSIDDVTGIISRRTLYYSHNASSSRSVIPFENGDGNLPFISADHDFEDGRCTICRAPESIQRPGRENYAYSFIHGAYPTEEMNDMKFDVIVGNPPYQINSDGNTRTKPIYHQFVEQAMGMEPTHLVMITPSRWFAGGLGLDSFRARMLGNDGIVALVDYPQSKDCFPGVKIRGGVSYFLWNRDFHGPSLIRTGRGGTLSPPMSRRLDDFDVFVRFNEGVSIINKVVTKSSDSLADRVSSLVPFGIRAKFRDYVDDSSNDAIDLYIASRKTASIARSSVANNKQWIDKYKTLIHAAYGEDHDGPYSVLANPFVAGPGSACTETYLVVGAFDTIDEASNLAAFLRTRFARFLVWLRMNTQHVRKELFRFVPELDWSRPWTEQELFEFFELDEAEIAVIEENIREMSEPAKSS